MICSSASNMDAVYQLVHLSGGRLRLEALGDAVPRKACAPRVRAHCHTLRYRAESAYFVSVAPSRTSYLWATRCVTHSPMQRCNVGADLLMFCARTVSKAGPVCWLLETSETVKFVVSQKTIPCWDTPGEAADVCTSLTTCALDESWTRNIHACGIDTMELSSAFEVTLLYCFSAGKLSSVCEGHVYMFRSWN